MINETAGGKKSLIGFSNSVRHSWQGWLLPAVLCRRLSYLDLEMFCMQRTANSLKRERGSRPRGEPAVATSRETRHRLVTAN